jgi:hypothetical protein
LLRQVGTFLLTLNHDAWNHEFKIYYSKSALHVLGDVFAHHQEHFTVFTASGSIHSSRCRLVSWMLLMMGENII